MQQTFDYKKHKNTKARVKQRIKSEFNYCCAYCGFQSKRITLDHVIPESKGGMDIRGNLVPACVKCNRSKGSKNLADWYIASLAFYSEERLQRILNQCRVKPSALIKSAKGFDVQG